MRLRWITVAVVGLWLVCSCSTGVRDIDFEGRRYWVTVDADSAKGVDSSRLAQLRTMETMYSFSKNGRGRQHTRQGTVSDDALFNWQIIGDSLNINQATFAVEQLDNGYKLSSDSAVLFLHQQP
ncbi:hypothetical protein BN8_03210 [Fibrisoma limi BUZ 3]|uniref:Lipocalin-like domain-containing protein n=1 Tax=Fibrisoma limi BUZ 3 TaxID=1185876 RepID=I2GJJ4_9BACT|nr:hypothetical protein [Fibrisoma limi]CCH54069.1 hypothetical protein BN8_03210 [Fibrisoma limi BUZ 3]